MAKTFLPIQVVSTVFSAFSSDIFVLVLWKESCLAKVRKSVDVILNCWRPTQLLHAHLTSTEIQSTLLRTRQSRSAVTILYYFERPPERVTGKTSTANTSKSCNCKPRTRNVLVRMASVHPRGLVRGNFDRDRSIKAIGLHIRFNNSKKNEFEENKKEKEKERRSKRKSSHPAQSEVTGHHDETSSSPPPHSKTDASPS